MPLVFDAVLYGGANFANNWGPGVKATRRFGGYEGWLLPEYQAMLTEVGSVYLEKVKAEFAAKHGRTGETEESIHEEFTPMPEGVDSAFLYRVVVGGNVEYVINPIRAHEITARMRPTLYNEQSGPFRGRSENSYSPFGVLTEAPLRTVEWFQGGEESFGNDRSWYEDEQEMLAAEAFAGFAQLAARANLHWGRDAAGAQILSYPATQGRIYYGA